MVTRVSGLQFRPDPLHNIVNDHNARFWTDSIFQAPLALQVPFRVIQFKLVKYLIEEDLSNSNKPGPIKCNNAIMSSTSLVRVCIVCVLKKWRIFCIQCIFFRWA